MGGGGAGGVILLNIANYTDATICEFKGGKGGDMETGNNLKVGPGGGGGGILWITQNSLPSNLTTINNGGLNGVCTSYLNEPELTLQTNSCQLSPYLFLAMEFWRWSNSNRAKYVSQLCYNQYLFN